MKKFFLLAILLATVFPAFSQLGELPNTAYSPIGIRPQSVIPLCQVSISGHLTTTADWIPKSGAGYIDSKPLGVKYLTPAIHLPDAPKKRPWLRVAGYGLGLLGGVAKGLNQAWVAQPDRWGSGDGWAERDSWKRKYKNYDGGDESAAFFGAKTFNIWATDMHHFTNAVTFLGIAGGTFCLTLGEDLDKPRWGKIGLRFLIGSLSYWAGSNVTYNYVRYKKPF